jgi:hypothetical protein
VSGNHAGSGDEVLAALVPSLCRELADSQAALAQAVAAQARERIAELEARLRQLVSEAISQSYAAADPAALADRTRSYRSAALIGTSQTAARSGKLMKSTMPWPAACWTARTTT